MGELNHLRARQLAKDKTLPIVHLLHPKRSHSEGKQASLEPAGLEDG